MDFGNPSQPKGRGAGLGAAAATARAAFLISLSAREDAKPFGTSRGGGILLNARGKALAAAWRELGGLREGVEADAVTIGTRGLEGILIVPKPDAAALGGLVRLFKVLSALRLAQLGKTAALRNTGVTGPKVPPRAPPALWKKGYSEKSLADAAALAQARKALKGRQAR